MKLKALQQGQKIGIFSISSPLSRGDFNDGIQSIESLGFEVSATIDPCRAFESKDFMFACESPEVRASGFMQLIEDDSVGALISVRGGYGAVEVLPLLNYEKIAAARKPIIGYSDITTLLSAVYQTTGLPTIHGAMLRKEFKEREDDKEMQESVDNLLALISNPNFALAQSCDVVRGGVARGEAVVGNLSILISLIGTPWEPSLDNKILFLEDVGEAPYRVHRMLNHLRFAGKLDRLSGLVFGRFSDSEPIDGPTIDEVLEGSINDIFSHYGFPVLKGFPFGHSDEKLRGKNLPIPFGGEFAIDGARISLLESVVE